MLRTLQIIFLSVLLGGSLSPLYADDAASANQSETVVVELPDSTATQFIQETRLRNLILIIAAIAVVFIAFAIFLVLYKRKTDDDAGEVKEYKEAYLMDIFGATNQDSFHITEKPVMLGRVAGRDPEYMQYIVLDSSGIGRRHAVIEYKDHSFWLVDQGSINGSFVNDQPVRTEIRLKHADRIRVYKDEFEFVIPGMEKEEATLIAGQDDVPKASISIGAVAAGISDIDSEATQILTDEAASEAEQELAAALDSETDSAGVNDIDNEATQILTDEAASEAEQELAAALDPERETAGNVDEIATAIWGDDSAGEVENMPVNKAAETAYTETDEQEFDMSFEQTPEPTTEMADMLFSDDQEDDEATLLPEMVDEEADATITPGMDEDDHDMPEDATLRPEK